MSDDTTNGLAVRTEAAPIARGYNFPVGQQLRDLAEFARMLAGSGEFVPEGLRKAGPAGIAAAVLKAGELGIEPMAALAGMYVVRGKVGLSYDLMAAVLLRGGYRIEWLESDHDHATVRLTDRRDPERQPHVETFTLDDAKRAGLERNETWKKYPKNLLRARALSNAGRAYAADVLSGCYSQDEAREIEVRARVEAGPVKPVASREEWQAMPPEDREAHTDAYKAQQAAERDAARAADMEAYEALKDAATALVIRIKADMAEVQGDPDAVERVREAALSFARVNAPLVDSWEDSVRRRGYTVLDRMRKALGIAASTWSEAQEDGRQSIASDDTVDGESEDADPMADALRDEAAS